METLIIVAVAVVASFALGYFVGSSVNVNRRVADKRREYEDKLRELRTLPTEWTNENMEWNYKQSAKSFMAFVDRRSWNIGRMGNGCGSGAVLEKQEWYTLLHFFYVLSRSGLCFKVSAVTDDFMKTHNKSEDTEFQMDTYRMYPHLAERSDEYKRFKEMDEIIHGRQKL